jgi:hypothetical protein
VPRFTLQTDVSARATIPAALRCAWSAAIAAIDTEVWIRVEAAHVADGASIQIDIRRAAEDGTLAETLDSLTGHLKEGAFEVKWTVTVPTDKLAAVQGPFALVIAAAIDAYHVRAESPQLLLHRPRFSI